MKLKLLCFVITALSVITYAKKTTTSTTQQVVTNSAFNTFRIDQNASLNEIQRVRLQFSSDDGLIRPLLLGFTPDNAASDGFDYGYDAPNFDQFPNDMFWNINGEDYVIQGVGAFDETKQYPLNINITNPGNITIALTDLENFKELINVFIYDSLLNVYTALDSSDYTISLEANTYQNRFFVTFVENEVLSIANEKSQESMLVNYLFNTKEIYIKTNDLQNVKKVTLLNLLGQTIETWNKEDFILTDAIRIPVRLISEGTYVIKVVSDATSTNTKVIIRD